MMHIQEEASICIRRAVPCSSGNPAAQGADLHQDLVQGCEGLFQRIAARHAGLLHEELAHAEVARVEQVLRYYLHRAACPSNAHWLSRKLQSGYICRSASLQLLSRACRVHRRQALRCFAAWEVFGNKGPATVTLPTAGTRAPLHDIGLLKSGSH